jgi:tRNA(fMet)-specific endonuclease VapC
LCLFFTEPAIHRYEGLKWLKLRIKKTDLRIAAIALEQDAIVATRNLRDFMRVPGLRVEDWSK